MSNGNADFATKKPIMASEATLRDIFAAKAMVVAISEHPYGSKSLREEAARYAYAVADAMLSARTIGDKK